MRKCLDIVQIAATTADVFSGRLPTPRWAKWVDIAFSYSDQDAQIDIHVGGEELARNSVSNLGEADNLSVGLFANGNFWSGPVNQDSEVLVAVTEVTAGAGIVAKRYRDK